MIFLSGVFKPVPDQSVSTMVGSVVGPSLQVVFGRAFLVQLQRGDLETAKVFARAFLQRTELDSNARSALPQPRETFLDRGERVEADRIRTSGAIEDDESTGPREPIVIRGDFLE